MEKSLSFEKILYKLSIKGYADIKGNRMNIDFDFDNTGVNGKHKEVGNIRDLIEMIKNKLAKEFTYEVNVKGFVSVYGMRFEIDEHYGSGNNGRATLPFKAVNEGSFRGNGNISR